MTVPTAADMYYDPYNIDLNMNPYPAFARFREEAPLYYNEQHDFYALSRWDDVNSAVIDHETFSSGRGALLELIKSGIEIPPGTLIFEDPPIHNIHRNLLSRVFTPRKVLALEPQIREFTNRCLTRWSEPVDSTSSTISANRCPCGSSACCSAFRRIVSSRSPTTGKRSCRARPWTRWRPAKCLRSSSIGGPRIRPTTS